MDATSHVARGLDSSMGQGLNLCVSSGPPGRDPAGPKRPHHHRTRDAVGQPLRVGIVGCGTIVNAYLSSFKRLTSVNLVAAADLGLARAEAVADSYPGVRALRVEQLMADPCVELVLNLTV